MYNVVYTTRIKRDMKRLKKQGKDINEVVRTLKLLATGEPMPAQYRDHALHGELEGFREYHLEGDWLVVYQIDKGELILLAVASGSHAQILGM
jgi:mRNA interferase YafQ